MPLPNPADPAADTGVPLQCQGAGYPIDSTKIFRYASVGSGRGQCMYLTHNPSYNNDASRPITEVNFTGSDAKLSADQIGKFTTGGTLGSESSTCAGVVIPAQPRFMARRSWGPRWPRPLRWPSAPTPLQRF